MVYYRFRLLLNGGRKDSEEIIREKAYRKGVLALPGTSFMPGGGPTAYVRASFSLLEPSVVDEALLRLRAVLLEEQGRGDQRHPEINQQPRIRRLHHQCVP